MHYLVKQDKTNPWSVLRSQPLPSLHSSNDDRTHAHFATLGTLLRSRLLVERLASYVAS